MNSLTVDPGLIRSLKSAFAYLYTVYKLFDVHIQIHQRDKNGFIIYDIAMKVSLQMEYVITCTPETKNEKIPKFKSKNPKEKSIML